MTVGNELKLARERAGLSTEHDNVLSSFAAEEDLDVSPVARYFTHAPLTRDTPFIIHQPPVPPAPMRAARGRARLTLTVLALLGAAGLGAYQGRVEPPIGSRQHRGLGVQLGEPNRHGDDNGRRPCAERDAAE